MRAYEEPPRQLVEDGKVRFGTFNAPIANVNLRDAEPWSIPVPRALRGARLKEWQAFQVGHEDLFMNIALFNAKALALVQVKGYDRRTGEKWVFERKVAPWAFEAPTTLLRSEMSYRSRGCSVAFTNELAEDRIRIHLDIAKTRKTPSVQAEFTVDASSVQPMVVSIPFAKNRGMYSHKGLMPIEGEIRVGGNAYAYGPGNGFVLMDDHRGYYPYVMTWDWVTGADWVDGSLQGFNLTRNDSIEPERYNENAFWRDGKIHLLPPVRFQHGERDGTEVWTMRDDRGLVDLRFEVEIDGRVDVNALIVRSKYRGPFGRFHGTLRSEDGTSMHIDDMFGMGEIFYLRC